MKHLGRLVVGLPALLLCACERWEAPSEAKKTPPDLVAEMRKNLAPMTSLVAGAPGVPGYGENGQGARAWLSDEVRRQTLAYLKEVKQKNEGTKDGQEALSQLRLDMQDLIREARNQGRWRLADAAIEGFSILSPGDNRFAELKERAQIHMNRPEVVVTGFVEDVEKKQVYAFLEVTLHPGNETKNIQVRKGDEFFDLRFVDIVGNLRGIKLEYLKIPGEIFSAMVGG